VQTGEAHYRKKGGFPKRSAVPEAWIHRPLADVALVVRGSHCREGTNAIMITTAEDGSS